MELLIKRKNVHHFSLINLLFYKTLSEDHTFSAKQGISIPLISSVLAKFCSEGLKKREKIS